MARGIEVLRAACFRGFAAQ